MQRLRLVPQVSDLRVFALTDLKVLPASTARGEAYVAAMAAIMRRWPSPLPRFPDLASVLRLLTLPPILVATSPALRLRDGNHRLVAARAAGVQEIYAFVANGLIQYKAERIGEPTPGHEPRWSDPPLRDRYA